MIRRYYHRRTSGAVEVAQSVKCWLFKLQNLCLGPHHSGEKARYGGVCLFTSVVGQGLRWGRPKGP